MVVVLLGRVATYLGAARDEQHLGGSGVAPTECGGVGSHARGSPSCRSFSTVPSIFLTLLEYIARAADVNVPLRHRNESVRTSERRRHSAVQ